MSATKVTIIIPTRERPDTLASSLKTALNQDYPNLEIIVSDNCSAPATKEVVDAADDPRIKYINTGKRLGMSGNYEFAISHVEEGWIILIGDDDGLLPNSVGRVIALLEKTGLEALSSRQCTYNWPSRSELGQSILTVPLGKGYRILDAKETMKRLMHWKHHSMTWPQVYAGSVISSDLIKRVKKISGRFFESQIPDIYSTFAICSSIDKFVSLEEPFIIAGASKHSAGAAMLSLKDDPFLHEATIPWHPDLPLPKNATWSFSWPAIYCECYLQSAHLHNNIAQITPEYYLQLIKQHSHIGHELLDEDWHQAYAKHHGLDQSAIKSSKKGISPSIRLSQIRNQFNNYFGRYRIDQSYEFNIDDIYEASLIADAVIKLRPKRLSNLSRTFLRKTRAKLLNHRS